MSGTKYAGLLEALKEEKQSFQADRTRASSARQAGDQQFKGLQRKTDLLHWYCAPADAATRAKEGKRPPETNRVGNRPGIAKLRPPAPQFDVSVVRFDRERYCAFRARGENIAVGRSYGAQTGKRRSNSVSLAG